ncbi:hypothetical protein [Pedobacter sp. ASV28]|uniref:hypothetical protein n=1 Tax=Pedobacter sp. ASV28 TaxID=2795123 RepID=UPI0018EE2F3B|nr:hypothetical protein [Pedobacter sp. ASV28]
MRSRHALLCLAFIAASFIAFSQDSSTTRVSLQYVDQLSSTADRLEKKLDKQTTKALQQLQKQEDRMRRKLQKIDTLKANEIFGPAKEKLNKNLTGAKQYIPSLDTLASSLKFLEQNPQLLSAAKNAKEKLKQATEKMDGLKDKFQQAEAIKKYLKERRQYLKDQLTQFGFAKELKKINKQVYYYSEQLNEFKALLKDHKKAEKKAIELLSKTNLFQKFMRKHSELASLFRLPDPDNPPSAASLAGLQTRAQVNGLIQQQIAAGGSNAQAQFQQNMQSAQSQLSQLKNKLSKMGGNSSDDILPEGFRPNDQKKKSFLQRLEYGTNMQSQKATNFFPVTTDLGLSLGYKLNDRSIIGIGASYKLGLGSGWNHLRVSHQGLGLRSFIDWKIKGSFWLSGGYEQNYKAAFNSIAQLQQHSAWQQSGLIGVSKVISLKTKLFKKTKLQLLWDMLSYDQVPRTQPIVFRIGYQF